MPAQRITTRSVRPDSSRISRRAPSSGVSPGSTLPPGSRRGMPGSKSNQSTRSRSRPVSSRLRISPKALETMGFSWPDLVTQRRAGLGRPSGFRILDSVSSVTAERSRAHCPNEQGRILRPKHMGIVPILLGAGLWLYQARISDKNSYVRQRRRYPKTALSYEKAAFFKTCLVTMMPFRSSPEL